ncbi:MAG: diaminopropionate ammonia-lyase, partial [Alphaproteobacteria bacterium]
MIEKRPFRYFLNRNHGVPGIAVLPETGYARAKAEITTWPGYAPTPLVSLDAIAKSAGVARLHYKDEAARFGLASFKALGGAYAVMRVLQAELAKRD